MKKVAIRLALCAAIVCGLVFGGESLRAFIAYLELFAAILVALMCALFVFLAASADEKGSEFLRRMCQNFWLRVASGACISGSLVYAGYPKIGAFHALSMALVFAMLYSANRSNKISADDKNEVHP